mgnify:CR=1 FL=1
MKTLLRSLGIILVGFTIILVIMTAKNTDFSVEKDIQLQIAKGSGNSIDRSYPEPATNPPSLTQNYPNGPTKPSYPLPGTEPPALASLEAKNKNY